MFIEKGKLVTLYSYKSDDTSLLSKMYQQIKNILGLDFYSLKDFFNEIFFEFKENTCTIFITRRCTLLAEFFLRYFSKTTDHKVCLDNYLFFTKNDTKNYILSDKPDIDYILHLCGEKEIRKINIVDDICIHGNTLNRTRKYVEEYISEFNLDCKVETSAYMYSYETTSVIPKNFHKVSYDANWLNLSEKIVKVIRTLNFPYVSFINAYEALFKKNDFQSFIGSITSNEHLINFQLGYYENEEQNRDSFFIVEKQIPIFKEIEAQKCVRLYYNEPLNSLVVVPYVILNSLTTEENATPDTLLAEFEKIIRFYLNSNCVIKIIKFIESNVDIERDDSRLGSFLYCLASCVASQSYGNYFFATYLENSIKVLKNWQTDCIHSILNAFGREISELIIDKNNYLDYKNYTTIKLAKDDINASNLQAQSDVSKKCQESWFNFESRANNCASEFKLKDVLEEKAKDNDGYKYAFLLNLIKFCDAGIMAIPCTKTSHESFIKAGELGCLEVRKSLYESKKITNDLSELLESSFYYRYLIL